MSEISKAKALGLLKELAEEAHALRLKIMESPEFMRWQRDVPTAIGLIFNESKGHAGEFSAITFLSPTGTADRKYYLAALIKSKALLESMAREVEEFWDGSA
ncbi:MAG: hypothetical protein V3T30_03930, partial [Thermodesulfobacteriota bacterium]